MIQTKCKTGRENSENAGNVFVAEYRENMYDRRESLIYGEKIFLHIEDTIVQDSVFVYYRN